jgi:3-oxoacyl-[acyl-carrier-protein] synthase II
LVKGQSGVAGITLFDAHDLPVRFAAEVKNFDPHQYIPRKEVRRMARCSQFALAAAIQAVEDANLPIPFNNKIAQRSGVYLGTGMGGFDMAEQGLRTYLERGLNKVNPFSVPATLPNLSAFHLCLKFKAQAYSNTTATACAAANIAVAESVDIIKRGDCDIMLAGGTEAALTGTTVNGFTAMRGLSARNNDPAGASRPFDAERDGFVLGEGAAIFVLERLDKALARPVHIYAEILGSGQSSDTFHIAAPDPEAQGAIRAITGALNSAGVTTDQIDYINAHGSSTPSGDITETLAVKTVFSKRAYQIPVSATKSMLGHALGAAGGIELVACLKTIETNTIHPTINYHTPDPDCDLDCVPNQARQQQVDVVLSNSFGLGGQNSCLVLGRYQH